MGMGREHRIDARAGLSEDALDVHLVVGTGIDNEPAVGADQVRVGAWPRHIAWVARNKTMHAGCDLVELS